MVGVHESLDFCTVLGWVINLNKEGNLYHSAYIITQCLHRKCDLCDLCISEFFSLHFVRRRISASSPDGGSVVHYNSNYRDRASTYLKQTV